MKICYQTVIYVCFLGGAILRSREKKSINQGKKGKECSTEPLEQMSKEP